MGCRDDVGNRLYGKERRIIEDLKLILGTKIEAGILYSSILQIVDEVGSETSEFAGKVIFGCDLYKFAWTAASEENNSEKLERMEETVPLLLQTADKNNVFHQKFGDVRNRLDDESKHWQDFLLKGSVSYDVVKRMTLVERKQLLKKYATCLTVFSSGKGTFQGLQAEWDKMKPELDQTIMGCLRDMAEIAKGDPELM